MTDGNRRRLARSVVTLVVGVGLGNYGVLVATDHAKWWNHVLAAVALVALAGLLFLPSRPRARRGSRTS